MSAWVTYTENEVVKCPAMAERRHPPRGMDRRIDHRPCLQRLGRPIPGTVVMVRIASRDNAPPPGLCLVQDCPNDNCRAVLEVCYLAASNEAA